MEFAMSLSKIVFPALGGATTSALWPLPIGDTRSIILEDIFFGSLSKIICSFG